MPKSLSPHPWSAGRLRPSPYASCDGGTEAIHTPGIRPWGLLRGKRPLALVHELPAGQDPLRGVADITVFQKQVWAEGPSYETLSPVSFCCPALRAAS